MNRICEGSVVSKDMNVVHSINLLSLWSSNSSNHYYSMFLYLYILRSLRNTDLDVKFLIFYHQIDNDNQINALW